MPRKAIFVGATVVGALLSASLATQRIEEKEETREAVEKMQRQAASLKAENEALRTEVLELRKVAETTKPAREYSVNTAFARAATFQHDRWLKVPESGLVERIRFLGDKAEAVYSNTTEQRIKPDVTVWVLNKDGVIVDELTDSWLIDSLGPGETYSKSWRFSPTMPETLVFSRWARIGWDPKPAFVMVVGSKQACTDLLTRTEQELERLNAGGTGGKASP